MSSTSIAIRQNSTNQPGHAFIRAKLGHMSTQFETSLGKRVKLLRQFLGLNQEELQERMQRDYGVRVGQGYISDIERDKATPTWQVVAGLARALHTTADYLMLLTDNASGKNDHIDTITTEAMAAAKIVDNLPPKERQAALRVLTAFDEDYRDHRRQMRKFDQMKESIIARAGEEAWDSVAEYIREVGQATLDRIAREGTGNPFREFLDDISE